MSGNGERKTVSGFEILVFAITRALAVCGAACVVIGIIILAVAFFSSGNRTIVSYDEVARELSAAQAMAQTGADATSLVGTSSQIAIPDQLLPYFEGENEQTLRGWMEALSEDQQRDFLSNMVQVVREARANNADPVDAIDAYRTLKLQRIGLGEMDKYASMAAKVGYIAGIISLLLILSMLSLVLVMLAIERNTRPVSTAVQSQSDSVQIPA